MSDDRVERGMHRVVDEPERLEIRRAGPRRVALVSLVVGALGVAGWIVSVIVNPDRGWLSWLMAWTFTLWIALGALAFVMIGHAVGARWFVLVRRLVEAQIATIPLLALLFLPLIPALGHVWEWVPPLDGLKPETIETITKKEAWLNVPFFLGRSILYLAAWSVLAWLLRSWSLRQDRGEPGMTERMKALAAGGLVVYGLTETFAAFDWIMSLDPTWHSTIFGAYTFAGGILTAIAVTVLLARAFEGDAELADLVAPSHYYALGRLMLVFLVFWAYMAFSQGFLIYIGDLPHEVTWYLARSEHGWMPVFLVIMLGHFLLPFLALLSYRLKRNARALSLVAGWIVLMDLVDFYWLVVPKFGEHRTFHPGDVAALAAVLGLTVAFGAWRAAGDYVVPRGDPRIADAIGYSSK